MPKHPVYGYLTKSEFEAMRDNNRAGAKKYYQELAAKRQADEFLKRHNSQKNRK